MVTNVQDIDDICKVLIPTSIFPVSGRRRRCQAFGGGTEQSDSTTGDGSIVLVLL